MGAVLVDIGAGATTIAVFENGSMIATSTLPIGGDFVTNDIAYGLRTLTDQAERVKLKFGCAYGPDAQQDQVFKVLRIGSNVEKEFSQVDLSAIIEPRVQEIFQMIRQEVKRLGFSDMPGGYVLTGGTVCMSGVLAVAQAELEATVRIAVPDFIGVRDPGYTSGVGIIHHEVRQIRTRATGAAMSKKPPKNPKAPKQVEEKPSIFERVKKMFEDFI